MDLDDVKQGLKSAGKKVKVAIDSKLLRASMALLIAAVPVVYNQSKAQAFDGKTHKFLVNQGLSMLKHDKGSKAWGIFNQKNGIKTLVDYSVKPDYDENDGGIGTIGGFRGHFYDPTTGTNFMGESDNTANNRFCEHYDIAVEKYKDGKKTESFKELGRALHYLGDLNSPHHAANMPNFESPDGIWLTHADYEAWVDRNYSKYAIKGAPDESYDYALDNSTWQIGHDMAINARDNVYLVEDFFFELDVNNKKLATENVLPKAERVTAAVLNKFREDVRS